MPGKSPKPKKGPKPRKPSIPTTPEAIGGDLKIYNFQLSKVRKAKPHADGFVVYQRVVIDLVKFFDKAIAGLEANTGLLSVDVDTRSWIDLAGELTVMEEQLHFLERKGGPQHAKPKEERDAAFRSRLNIVKANIKTSAKRRLKELETITGQVPVPVEHKVSAWRVGSEALTSGEYVTKQLESMNDMLASSYDVKLDALQNVLDLFTKSKKTIMGLNHVLKDEKMDVTSANVGEWIEIFAQYKLALHMHVMFFKQGSSYVKKHHEDVKASRDALRQSMALAKQLVVTAFKEKASSVKAAVSKEKVPAIKEAGTLMPTKAGGQTVADQLRSLQADLRKKARATGQEITIPSSLSEWEEYGFDKRKPFGANKIVLKNVMSNFKPRKVKK